MEQSKRIKGNRTERKKETTRRKIMDVAMDLFRQQGVESTTMEQIAAEVDIAKGTLYNYFSVKEAIIDEYIKRSFQENNDERVRQIRTMPDTRSRLNHYFQVMFEGVRTHRDIFEKYLIYRMQTMVTYQPEESERSGFQLTAAEIIGLGRENGEIRSDLPFHVVLELFEFAFIELVKQFFAQSGNFDAPARIEQYVDLCLRGLQCEGPNIKG
jgi:AcrR family transcriptional regulator